MQDTKQQSTEAVLAIARDVEEQVQVLGERVAALFVAVEEARGNSGRLSFVLSTHVVNNVRGVHSHSHWSHPLPPMEGFEDAIRWSLYQQPQGEQSE